ncbi:unnamed protein product, partial [Amoebophrya sp. A120]
LGRVGTPGGILRPDCLLEGGAGDHWRGAGPELPVFAGGAETHDSQGGAVPAVGGLCQELGVRQRRSFHAADRGADQPRTGERGLLC